MRRSGPETPSGVIFFDGRTGNGFVKAAHEPADRHEALSPFTCLLVEGVLFGAAEFFLLAITLWQDAAFE